MVEREKIIFMAGVLDSSSHIGIKCTYGREYTPLITITRKDGPIIDMFLDAFGGYKLAERNTAVFRGRIALKMIEQLSPFMVNKREHVQVLAELDESFQRYLEKGKRGRPIGKRERDLREKLYLRMKELNGGRKKEEEIRVKPITEDSYIGKPNDVSSDEIGLIKPTPTSEPETPAPNLFDI